MLVFTNVVFYRLNNCRVEFFKSYWIW